MISTVAAIIATVILCLLAVFQLLLIVGLPLGKFAWGGYHTVLPAKLRIASVTSLFLYTFFSLVILENAGVIDFLSGKWVNGPALWILVAYFFLGIFMNGISQSKNEKLLMTPVASLLFVCSLLVALAV
jgi:hypothetical protein